MLPQSLLLYSLFPSAPARVNGRKIGLSLVPHYFSERDYPWVSRFYEEFLRFKGKRRRELLAFFQGELPFQSPEKKRALLLHILLRASEDDQGRSTGKTARALRTALFECSARSLQKPEVSVILQCPEIAGRFPGAASELLETAFSDLILERRMVRMPEGLTPERMSLNANLALAQGLIGRSSEVEVRAEGDIRRIVRQAQLRQLIIQAQILPENRDPAPLLRISGPLSLFGHTTVYGRALSELVPLLCWCNRFTLAAIVRVRGKDACFRVRSGDPILPATEPKHFDSRLEERFARDFGAEATDWDLIREPEPFQVHCSSGLAGSMIFPDFLIRHRRVPRYQYYLEIVGYWTEDYLQKKIKGLRTAAIPNLILCVDESLNCGQPLDTAEWEKLGTVLFFKKRISIAAVLSKICDPIRETV